MSSPSMPSPGAPKLGAPKLGAHMSIAGGLHKAVERGRQTGCESIQIFTRNSNRWKSKARTAEELELYRQTLAESDIDPVVAHAIYLINLASPEQDVYAQSYDAFCEELARCHEAGIPYLVLHPGSHKGTGLEEGIARIAEGICRAYAEHPEYTVITLLENTAGQGDTIGRTFEELAQIAGLISSRCAERDQTSPPPIGYCFDTAHALASGYELRTVEGYAETWERFERVLGLERLYCFHLNDSKYDLAAGRDRHEHIGQGYLGLEPFRMLLNDPRFAGRPMLLETPKEAYPKPSQDAEHPGDTLPDGVYRADIENLAVLRGLIQRQM
jgi:deoxyribonuclease-4